jgi:hypothetical protein
MAVRDRVQARQVQQRIPLEEVLLHQGVPVDLKYVLTIIVLILIILYLVGVNVNVG